MPPVPSKPRAPKDIPHPPAERTYRAARKTHRASEDEVLNALSDSRLNEPRRPLQNLLKKLEHDLAK